MFARSGGFHLVRWHRRALGALAFVLATAACSSSGDEPPETTSADPPVATSADPPSSAGATTVPASTTTVASVANDPVPQSTRDARLTLSGPGLGGDEVETIAEDELSDGLLVFVSELPEGTPGTTVTVADQELQVLHTAEFDEAPFVLSTGWPDRAIVRQSVSLGLLDASTGDVSIVAANGGGSLSVFGLRPGQRYASAVEVGGDGAAYLVDLQERALVPIAGTVRSGPPAISADGQWVVAVPDMGPRGAASLQVVRPYATAEPLIELLPSEGEVFERWFFDAGGMLWVTSRPLDPIGDRLVHAIDLDSQTVTPWYDWSGSVGHRLIAVAGDRHVVQERKSLDHFVVDLEGEVLVRVVDPVDAPKVYGDFAAYIDENDVRLVDLRTGELTHFLAIGSPTPSEVDFGDDGQFWIADGYAIGEIGLFRVDLRRGVFVDHRSAVAGLPTAEHFFSFDETRFRRDGDAVVVFQGEETSWLVHLDADGAGSVLEMPTSHRVVDVSWAPSGEQAIMLSGNRDPGIRESVAAIVAVGDTMARDSKGDILQRQKLAVWLPG